MNATSIRSDIIEQKKASQDWLEANFYDQWEQVWKNYLCEPDPEKDENGKPDPTLSSIGMPDTWGYVRRTTARITAQIPNLRFHARSDDVAELISRTLMYQWDKSRAQRVQKLNVTQALLFGISVKAWYWQVDEHRRVRRINPYRELSPADMDAIIAEYQLPRIVEYGFKKSQTMRDSIVSRLMAKHSRGGMLPLHYAYKEYEGPKSDWLFIGDCYFEPDFASLQTSNWFIVERRRNLAYLKNLIRLYPQMKPGIEAMIKKYPHGTPRWHQPQQDTTRLRQRMLSAIDRDSPDETNPGEFKTQEWTLTERHIPGENPRWALLGEDDIFLGEVEHPYDLAGRIPFVDTIFIDDLLCGIGHSTARVMRGLQLLHERQVNRRVDLIYNILRPLIGTTNRELLENPGLIKRHAGFRMVYMRGAGDMWVQGEQAAMAAAAAGLSDEQGIMRLLQALTGENNMTMAANVDPQQAKTATGAKLMQQAMDVLTKDLNDQMNLTSTAEDGQIMYLLNRSELSDPIEFNGALYSREYSSRADPLRKDWQRATPEMFQIEGQVVPEVGSTLAFDDETKVAKATDLWNTANQRPDLFNMPTARDEVLIAHGKGSELQRWAAPQPEGPPPPELKASVSYSIKGEELPPEVKAKIIAASIGDYIKAAPELPLPEMTDERAMPPPEAEPPQPQPVQ